MLSDRCLIELRHTSIFQTQLASHCLPHFLVQFRTETLFFFYYVIFSVLLCSALVLFYFISFSVRIGSEGVEEGRRYRSMSMEEYDVPNVRRLSLAPREGAVN